MPLPSQWLKALDVLGGLVEIGRTFRKPPPPASAAPDTPAELQVPPSAGPLGQLEARLAGVVVAALKEAFDRDRVRMDLERTHLEAERRRAEETLRLELRRQAGDRVIAQLRLYAAMALAVWLLSAALAVFVPGMRLMLAKVLLGIGWMALAAALASAFVTSTAVARWLAHGGDGEVPEGALAWAPWMLVAGLAGVAASLMAAL